MGKQVVRNVYIADDGREFKTAEKMEAYEGATKYAATINQYLDSRDFSEDGQVTDQAAKAQRTRTSNVLAGFLNWADKQKRATQVDISAVA